MKKRKSETRWGHNDDGINADSLNCPTIYPKVTADSYTSIAVLPFVNRSANDKNELFCEGITEEIIHALAKIPQLKVTSKHSSFRFKETHLSLAEIAEQLQVETFLEGSVRIDNQQIRVAAQLINVAEDYCFWSHSWDRPLANLFALQDELSTLIADQLREHFGPLEIKDKKEQNSQNLAAYEHLLKGKALFNKWNPQDANTAIGHFVKAIELDSNLIDAWIGLADGYSFLAIAGFAPREAAWQKANHALDRAAKIDSQNAALNYLLANKAFFTQASFSQAFAYAQKSIQAKPNYSEAQQFMAFLYLLKGDVKQAQTHLHYAKSIDPLNAETRFYEAYFHYRTEDFPQAQALLEGLLAENDKNIPALITLFYVLLKTKNIATFDQKLAETPQNLIMPDERLGLLCLRDVIAGKSHSEHIKTLMESAKDKNAHQAHAYLFLWHTLQENATVAYTVLNNLFDHQSSVLLLAFSDPLAHSLFKDKKYSDYHQRIYRLSSAPIVSKAEKPPVLDDENAKRLKEIVEVFMADEQPYLNPALSLRSLAELLNVHPNQLSWLLNAYFHQNFNGFINTYRVNHFKTLIIDPDNSHISILGLAFESGFNSKTVFNTAFKKITGQTPKAFQKSATIT